MKTYASNPGNVRVKYLRVLAHSPTAIVLFGGGGAALLSSGYVFNNLFLTIAGGVFVGLLIFGLDGARHQFSNGDVNISKVLSLDPPLFATSTNMRNGYGDSKFPAVKIVHGKVPSVRGKRWEVGDYFPAACLYSGSLKKPHWDNFFPEPLSRATDDLAVIEHHNKNLEYLRDELDARLSLVDSPGEPGIYFIDEERLSARQAEGRLERSN